MAAATAVADLIRPMRGKLRFMGGEKVLCYEPDPNKAKVVYDAKILEVQANYDEKGKKQNEYLVHFQGWNSSWDRYVLEDMLLKDCDENRILQQELFEEAQELQRKLNRKKKMERRMSEKIRTSVDSMDTEGSVRERSVDGSLVEDPDDGEIQFSRFKVEVDDTVSEADTDTMTEPASSPNKLNLVEELQQVKIEPIRLEEPEDFCIEVIPLPLSEGIKRKLEQDHLMINSKNKLVKLPAQPNIVTLLEMFVRNYAIQRLAALEKQLGKGQYSQYRMTPEKEVEKYEEAANNINICKEVAEGVRIILDFQLGNILLYPSEEDQFAKSIQLRPHMENIERQVVAELPEPPSAQAGVKRTSTSSRKHALSESQAEAVEGGKKRNRLSVGKEEGIVPGSVGSTSSGTATPTMSLPTPGSGHSSYPQTSKSHAILGQVYSWKLVPETLYFDYPVPASLVYGGVHLTRLLVKLPEILAKMRFSTKSCRNIIKYLEYLVEFLTNQQDIFSESNYV
eukprot:GFUD01044649.1.p1 GENE.GFUD01044649.1~~GFUD01044649.1.p1  ORF type:complete len:509 (+),score=166.28 GFUD01044649.1:46-1572(+)